MDRTRKENVVLYSLLAASATMAVGGLFFQIKHTYRQITAVGIVQLELPQYSEIFSKKIGVAQLENTEQSEQGLVDQITIARSQAIKTPRALLKKKAEVQKAVQKVAAEKIEPQIQLPHEPEPELVVHTVAPLLAESTPRTVQEDAEQNFEAESQKIKAIHDALRGRLTVAIQFHDLKQDVIAAVDTQNKIQTVGLDEVPFEAPAAIEKKQEAQAAATVDSISTVQATVQAATEEVTPEILDTYTLTKDEYSPITEALFKKSAPIINSQNDLAIKQLEAPAAKTVLKTKIKKPEPLKIEIPTPTREETIKKEVVETPIEENREPAFSHYDSIRTLTNQVKQTIAPVVVEYPKALSTQVEEKKSETPVTTQNLVGWVMEHKKEQTQIVKVPTQTIAQNPVINPNPQTPVVPDPSPKREDKKEDEGHDASAGLNITEQVKQCDSMNLGLDAFVHYSKQELVGICRKPVSDEGKRKEGQARWWEIKKSTETEDYWTTLVFQSPTDSEKIEIISDNNIKFLSVLAKTTISAKTGIVFGRIGKNSTVQLSGRAEQPIYFNEIDKPAENKKHFVFLNVEPGALLLYVNGENGESKGSLPLIVKSTAATYVNIEQPTLRKVSGNVWASESSTPKPMSGVSIEIIGQAGKKAVTSSKGAFEISDVLQYGKYPVYVDLIKNETSYRHRYRLSENDEHWLEHNYFFFNESTVDQWLNQLEGGVKENTGIIIGAVKAPVGSQIKIKQIEAKESSKPEVYQINGNNQLIPGNKVSDSNVRFMVIQVPEGISSVSVDQDGGKRVWSASAITQRGVISVVEN